MNYETLIIELKNKVSEKRLRHILLVAETAKKIAIKYKISQQKIEIAALLHDLLREIKLNEMQEICKKLQYKELVGYENMFEILHGFAAAEYVKKKLKVDDYDILNAVRYHTIGRKEMSLLEKIIYISDAIEPDRNYSTVEEIRALVDKDINKGMLLEVRKKIEYLEKKGGVIHPNTIELRNWLEESLEEK